MKMNKGKDIDLNNIQKVDASGYEKLNMGHEFQAHNNDQAEIIRNIKKEQEFKKHFGKDNVINVKKGA